MKKLFESWRGYVEEVNEVKHDCANHVKENATGREGVCINHTLLEDGTVTHYTVEFQNEIVEDIPVADLTILALNEHMHAAKRDDYDHDDKKPRRKHKGAKPDFLDLDKDGDKKEPMKLAAKQAKQKKKIKSPKD